MGFFLLLYAYLIGKENAKRKLKKKEILKKENGIKGVRDTLREIDEEI